MPWKVSGLHPGCPIQCVTWAGVCYGKSLEYTLGAPYNVWHEVESLKQESNLVTYHFGKSTQPFNCKRKIFVINTFEKTCYYFVPLVQCVLMLLCVLLVQWIPLVLSTCMYCKIQEPLTSGIVCTSGTMCTSGTVCGTMNTVTTMNTCGTMNTITMRTYFTMNTFVTMWTSVTINTSFTMSTAITMCTSALCEILLLCKLSVLSVFMLLWILLALWVLMVLCVLLVLGHTVSIHPMGYTSPIRILMKIGTMSCLDKKTPNP